MQTFPGARCCPPPTEYLVATRVHCAVASTLCAVMYHAHLYNLTVHLDIVFAKLCAICLSLIVSVCPIQLCNWHEQLRLHPATSRENVLYM